MADQELKPCPFCGSERVCVLGFDLLTKGDLYYTYCSHCLAYGSECSTKAAAIQAWNNVPRIADTWQPTPEAINALPQPLREYIHSLETDADPAGTIRELSLARDLAKQLEAKVAEMEAQLKEARGVARGLVREVNPYTYTCVFCSKAGKFDSHKPNCPVAIVAGWPK